MELLCSRKKEERKAINFKAQKFCKALHVFKNKFVLPQLIFLFIRPTNAHATYTIVWPINLPAKIYRITFVVPVCVYIYSLSQLSSVYTRAGLLVSFACKQNTFRKRVKNVVTSKGLQVGVECK